MKSISNKLTLIALFFSFIFMNSCIESETSSMRYLNADDLDAYDIRWNSSNLPLEIYLDDKFDFLEESSVRVGMETWNDIPPHNPYFFNIVPEKIPARYYFASKILVTNSRPYPYDDDLLGVYKIEEWFEDLEDDALAITYFWLKKNGSYYQMIGADILLNWPYFENGTYDLQSVVVHEAGHMLGLRHTDNTSEIMYTHLAPGQEKHSFHENDIHKILRLYGFLPQEKRQKRKIAPHMPDEIRGYFTLYKDGTKTATILEQK